MLSTISSTLSVAMMKKGQAEGQHPLHHPPGKTTHRRGTGIRPRRSAGPKGAGGHLGESTVAKSGPGHPQMEQKVK